MLTSVVSCFAFLITSDLTLKQDVEFVLTHDGQLPNKDNSTPLDGADGRGSCVWFNQETMFQSSELGYGTVQEAAAAGADTSCDAEALLHKDYFPLPV
jgi:hypothetical protein